MSTELLRLTPVPIRLRGCGKHFGGQRVLESMDLDIAAGETVVLLGLSGCDKTTMLRIVVGLEVPGASGTMRFGDEDVTARPIECHRAGMMFQSYALFSNLSVHGNVEYGLHIQCRQNGLSDTQTSAWANMLLEMIHLASYADHGVAQLSDGQCQRVALVHALAPEPHVPLLDEPPTALDVKLRESMRTEMDRLLCGPGITTIYVTHDQGGAMTLADHIAVIEAGRIARVGTPREIYFQSANRYVADFIGIMSRLGGTRGGGAFVYAGGRIPIPADDGNAIFFCPEDAVLTGPAQAVLKGAVESTLFLGFRTRARVMGVSATPLFIGMPGRQQFALGRTVSFDVLIDRLLTLQT